MSATIRQIQQILTDRMFPLTLGGISEAINALKRREMAPLPA